MISRGLCVLGVVALVIALLTTYDSSSSTKAGSFYVTAPELGGRPVATFEHPKYPVVIDATAPPD